MVSDFRLTPETTGPYLSGRLKNLAADDAERIGAILEARAAVVTHVNLGYNALGLVEQRFAAMLQRAVARSSAALSHLDLGSCGLGGPAVLALAAAVAQRTDGTLVSIVLRGNRELGDAALVPLLEACASAGPHSPMALDFSACGAGAATADALAALIECPTARRITCLSVGQNTAGFAAGMGRVADALARGTRAAALERLDVKAAVTTAPVAELLLANLRLCAPRLHTLAMGMIPAEVCNTEPVVAAFAGLCGCAATGAFRHLQLLKVPFAPAAAAQIIGAMRGIGNFTYPSADMGHDGCEAVETLIRTTDRWVEAGHCCSVFFFFFFFFFYKNH
jgi:hypothetical protein